jgi:hypothetical protein
MGRGRRLVVFWLGVCAVGAAIGISWWSLFGFQVPICQDVNATDHCLSYDQIRAWTSQTSDLGSGIAVRANNWAALIVAVFTAVLAIFTIGLWRSTQKLWAIQTARWNTPSKRREKNCAPISA